MHGTSHDALRLQDAAPVPDPLSEPDASAESVSGDRRSSGESVGCGLLMSSAGIFGGLLAVPKPNASPAALAGAQSGWNLPAPSFFQTRFQVA